MTRHGGSNLAYGLRKAPRPAMATALAAIAALTALAPAPAFAAPAPGFTPPAGVPIVGLAQAAARSVTAWSAGPAAVSPVGGTPGVPAARGTATRLWFTVATGESPYPAQRRFWLTCEPTGGNHRSAAAACAALASVRGDIASLPPGGDFCTAQYDPVTVTASGQWRGQTVRYRHTFGNACVLRNETGPVFAG